MVTQFEVGKRYRCVHRIRPPHFNDLGHMDKVLDGEYHLCAVSTGTRRITMNDRSDALGAIFENMPPCTFGDHPNDVWYWFPEDFDEYLLPPTEIVYIRHELEL